MYKRIQHRIRACVLDPLNQAILVALAINILLGTSSLFREEFRQGYSFVVWANAGGITLAALVIVGYLLIGDHFPIITLYFFLAFTEVVCLAMAITTQVGLLLSIASLGLGIFIIHKSSEWQMTAPEWLAHKQTLPFIGRALVFLSVFLIGRFWG